MLDVTGKVTYNGNPLNDEGCHIVFQGPDGSSVTAPIAPTGEYKASGVIAGVNKVAIFFRNPEATKSHDPSEKTAPSGSPLRNLPSKYADVNKSELSFDTNNGLVFNVDMTGGDLNAAAKKTAPKAQKANSGKGKPHNTGTGQRP
jgi:hypothetical protein